MAEDRGISRGLQTTLPTAMTMAAFAAIAIYNVLELAFIIVTTFKRRKGLYFYSFIVATLGILPYTLGFVFKFFDVIPQTLVSVTMIVIGWCCMITGQSLVLYSRLHLVVWDHRILRWVLAMIVLNAIICHVPISIFAYGANSNNPAPFTIPYSIYEKVQITLFFIQELIISGLYMFSSVNILKPAGNIQVEPVRTAMTHLIYINAIIVVLDLTLLATEYAGYYDIQVLYKAALYSIKLKLEFRILNQLVKVTKSSNPQEWSRNQNNDQRLPESISEILPRHFQPAANPTVHPPFAGYVVRVSGGNDGGQQDPEEFTGITLEKERVTQYSVQTSRGNVYVGQDAGAIVDFVVKEERIIERENVPWSNDNGEKCASIPMQRDQVDGIGRTATEKSLRAGFSKIHRSSQMGAMV